MLHRLIANRVCLATEQVVYSGVFMPPVAKKITMMAVRVNQNRKFKQLSNELKMSIEGFIYCYEETVLSCFGK